jgi:NADH-ubiquinone oxidoreductase chain 4
LIPRMSFWWFMLSVRNIAAAPSLNLLGEIRLLNRLISWSWFRIFFLFFFVFF